MPQPTRVNQSIVPSHPPFRWSYRRQMNVPIPHTFSGCTRLEKKMLDGSPLLTCEKIWPPLHRTKATHVTRRHTNKVGNVLPLSFGCDEKMALRLIPFLLTFLSRLKIVHIFLFETCLLEITKVRFNMLYGSDVHVIFSRIG